MAADTRKSDFNTTDEKVYRVDHDQLARTISSVGMSPIDSTEVSTRLKLLQERPQGPDKIDHIECVCLAADSKGSEQFRVDATQRTRAERLLTAPDSKIVAFFINQEEEFYDLYREHGPEKAFRVSVFFQMHNDSLKWLLDTVQPHSSYVQALANTHGYHGSFTTHDESMKPRYLHISIKVPHNGGLGAAAYIRWDLKEDRTVIIMSCQTRLQTLEDHFTRSNGDSGLAKFKARFPSADGVGFEAGLNLLDEYSSALYHARKYAWTKLIALERITGKGTLYSWSDIERPDLRNFSTGDLEQVHRCVTEANSNVVAANFQVNATETFMAAHDKYCSIRALWHQPCAVDSYRQLAMKETLVTYHARVKCLVDNFTYSRDRVRIQLDAVNTNINQAIAERAGSSAASMMVLALVGLIFLPCGLIAQILGLGFFEVSQPAIQLDSSIGTIVLIFLMTILATLFCCGLYFAVMRLWRRSRQRNIDCLAKSLV